MTRLGFFLAGFIVGAWCAGLAMRWEQLRPAEPEPAFVEDDDGVQPADPWTAGLASPRCHFVYHHGDGWAINRCTKPVDHLEPHLWDVPRRVDPTRPGYHELVPGGYPGGKPPTRLLS